MKRIILFYILAFAAIFSSCEKQAEIKTSFPFSVESDFRKNIVINTMNETSFDLVPEQVVTTNVYVMSYRVLSGSGAFYLDNGDELLEDEATELDGLKFDGYFQSHTVGEVEVEVTFSDQQGEEQTQVFTYVSEDNPFSVDLNTVSTTATVDERKNFSLTLSNTGEDDNVTYTASLYLSQGTGTIELLDEDGEVVYELDQNETFDAEPGTYNYAVTLNDDGVNILNVDVTDSNNQKLSDTIEFSVNVINFNFSGEPEAIRTSLGNDLDLNFILSEIDGGNADYQMRYVFESGDADIYSGATQIFAGTNTDVALGQFSWLFRPTDIGTVQMTFYAVNSTNVEKEVTIEIEVTDRSFDFTATGALSNVPIGQGIDINYVISEVGGNQSDTYTMTYTSTNNGKLVVNGQEYQPGTVIVVDDLNFTATYFGSSLGDHVVTSTIKASSNGLSVSKETELKFTASEFSLDVTSNVELTVNESIDVEFLIQETVGESDLDISYTVSGPNQSIFNENDIELESGTGYDVQSNAFVWTLTALEQGQVTITYTVENQYGFKQSVPITYTVKPLQFDFTVASTTSTNYIDEYELYELDLSNVPSSLTYQLSVESSNTLLNGVKYNSVIHSESQTFDVSSASILVYINSNKTGNNNLLFTVTASNGVAVTKSLNIDFDQRIVATSLEIGARRYNSYDGYNQIVVDYTKRSSSRLVSIEITNLDTGSVNVITANTTSANTSYTTTDYCEGTRLNRCYPWGSEGSTMSVRLTDSNGNTSEPIIDEVEYSLFDINP